MKIKISRLIVISGLVILFMLIFASISNAALITPGQAGATMSNKICSSSCKEIDTAWSNYVGLSIRQDAKVWDVPSLSWKNFQEVYAGSSTQAKVSDTNVSTTLAQAYSSKGKCFDSALSNSASESERKLVSVDFQGRKISVNKIVAPLLDKINQEITASGVTYKFYSTGTYNWRCTKPTAGWSEPECKDGTGKVHRSLHSYGIAIDINPTENPYCYVNPKTRELCDDSARTKCGSNANTCAGKGYDIPQSVIDAFKKNGFSWGGDWGTVKDYMHFEWDGNIGDFNGDGTVEECSSGSSSGSKYSGTSKLFAYTSSCSSPDPETTARVNGIIIPSTASSNPDLYLYFHGNTEYTKTQGNNFITNYVTQKKLAESMDGKNAVMIVFKGPSPNQDPYDDRWMSGTEFDCYYNEALQQLKTKGKDSFSGLYLMGHSNGGKTINNVIQNGFLDKLTIPLKGVVYYDACYGSYCSGVKDNILQKGGSIYAAWSKEGVSVENKKQDINSLFNSDPNTWEENKVYSSSDNRIKEILTSNIHSDVPQKCFNMFISPGCSN